MIKYFASAQEFQKELKVYLLDSPMVPELMASQKPDWIKMERIFGIPYLDSKDGFDAAKLGLCLAGFHNTTLKAGKCLCHIDNQPANILLKGNSFYFIDFSDSRIDFPERDVTHLLLFWAADMPHNKFCEYVTSFISMYSVFLKINPKNWQSCLQESIACFDSRREKFNKPGGKTTPEEQEKNRKFLFQYDL